MKGPLKMMIIAVLLGFGAACIGWQLVHYEDIHGNWISSISTTYLREQSMATITNIIKRDEQVYPASGGMRNIDMRIPADSHVFMVDMTGPTNYSKVGQYFWMAYYLFPREVATSLDHVCRQTKDGFVGTTTESDAEIVAHGFEFRTDVIADTTQTRPLVQLPMGSDANPDWFDSFSDLATAFLLPLLTALTGMWLFRLLFSTLTPTMPLREQLAFSLGLGMMTVAALTLGVKLCGFHGRGLVLTVTAIGAIAELIRDRKALLTGFTGGLRYLVRSPIAAIFVVIALVVFLILFRIAGLEGLVDGDAMRWMLKVKMMYLFTGRELVQYFSNPAFAHTHLDYPTLVPALHSATYDSLGHMNEFVTKFWPTWMLFLLLAALTSMAGAQRGWFHAPSLGILGLLLVPAIQNFVQWEGSTMPMIFFIVLGFSQCGLWLTGKDPARLGLGLTLLFGAAMTKLEGFLFLALVVGWILLVPSARPTLKFSRRVGFVLGFGFLAALPFLCLRFQIPTLNYESSHMSDVLRNPSSYLATLSTWAILFLIELTRLFVNPAFAKWNGDDGHFHLAGEWDGLSSLYNPSTLGLAWFCVLLTVLCWFALRERRPVLTWLVAMFIGAVVMITGIFVTFVSLQGLTIAISYTNEEAGGRYLLPVLLAWFTTLMTLLFAGSAPHNQLPAPAKVVKPAKGANQSQRKKGKHR